MKNLHLRLVYLFAAAAICALLLHSASAATVRASLRPADARIKAPNLTLQDASGHSVQLSDYRGEVVLLNFWATDCGGCRLEIPFFADLDTAHKSRGLAVIGVSMDIAYEGLKSAQQAWSRVERFVHAHDVKYTILMDDDSAAKAYRVEALPITYLIDTNGRVAAKYAGVVNKESIEANVKSLLAER